MDAKRKAFLVTYLNIANATIENQDTAMAEYEQLLADYMAGKLSP